MTNHVTIGIFGCVSAGKSTLLKTILGEDYTPSKKRKTTLVPQVYRECVRFPLISIDDYESPSAIKNKNDIINEKLSTKMNEGQSIELEDVVPLVHSIKRIETFLIRNELNPETFIQIYDIPGLNDSLSKNVFFEWIRNNFNLFDIVIFVTDIDKGLNNCDEMDILDLLIECIKIEGDKGKNIGIIPVINKCDNVRYDKKSNEMSFRDENEDDNEENEDEEIYNQANNILKGKLKNMCNFIPLSAELGFIYSLIIKQSNTSDSLRLPVNYFNILGEYEYGKRKWKESDKEGKNRKIAKIASKLDNNDHAMYCLYNTGYYFLRDKIQTIIKDNQGNYAYNHFIDKVNMITDIDIIDEYLDNLMEMINEQHGLAACYDIQLRTKMDLINNSIKLLSQYYEVEMKKINDIITSSKVLIDDNIKWDDYIVVHNYLFELKNINHKISSTIKLFDANISEDIIQDNIRFGTHIINNLENVRMRSIINYEWNPDTYHEQKRIYDVISTFQDKDELIKSVFKRIFQLNHNLFFEYFHGVSPTDNDVIKLVKKHLEEEDVVQILMNLIYRFIDSRSQIFIKNKIVNPLDNPGFYLMKSYSLILNKYFESIRHRINREFLSLLDDLIDMRVAEIRNEYNKHINENIVKYTSWMLPTDDDNELEIETEIYLLKSLINPKLT